MLSIICAGSLLLAGNKPLEKVSVSLHPSQKQAIDKKDTSVEPTSWGNVVGRVYDASTGAPIMNATVRLQTDTGFEEKGRSVDATDDLGQYKAQCILGRISHNVDVGRAILSSGIGLLFGSAQNTTKRIDASRVGVHVDAPGYKSFEGVVSARSQFAPAFQINLQPILMVPDGASGISMSANDWTAVRIENAQAVPAVAHKGDVVKLTVDVKAFGKNLKRNIEIAAVSRLWKGDRDMKLSKDTGEGGLVRFETDFHVSGREKYKAEIITFYVRKSALEFDSRKAIKSAVLQIADTQDEEQQAKSRTDGVQLLRENKPNESVQIFKKLADVAKPSICDLELLVSAADKTSNFSASADAWKELVKRAGKDDSYEVSQYVKALYLGKRYDEIPSVVEPLVRSKKVIDWERTSDPMTIGYLGLAYVKLDSLDKAKKLNENLLGWPESGLKSSVIEFRNSLRLAEVEAQLKLNPGDPNALSEFGRTLLDLGRYEEAVGKLTDAIAKGQDLPAIKRDLAWAGLQIRGKETKIVELVDATANAKAALNIGSKQESKDFFNWNQYAVFLYALSEQQRVSKAPEANATADEAINTLRKALSLGRKGALRTSGAFDYNYGYLSGSEVAISGFAYPQANASYILLDSLKRLRKNPDDYLALFNQGNALVDLGQLNLAKQSLDHLQQVKPNYAEALYVQAMIEARSGKEAKAQEYLEKLLAINPIHPRANLVMAELLAKDGDVAGSAERLANHARFYGDNYLGGG